MPDRSDRAKAVLSYLERMVELCRRAHRPDLVTDYEDAWQTAAAAILGPLPKRPDNRAIYTGEIVPRPLTPGQRESLASPWRRIIARDGGMEILECGHRMFHIEVPGSPTPKRRRCRDCFLAEAQTKKPAAGEPAPQSKKGAYRA